jgi:hypothetical protein
MRISVLSTLSCLWLITAATAAAAHPGHGLAGASTWLHYLSDPLHLAPVAVAGLVIAWRRRGATARTS